MKIGFFLKYMVGTLNPEHKDNVWGEEILAKGFSEAIKKIPGVESCGVYAPNKPPEEKLDVLIYMNYDTDVVEEYATKSICYIQNAYADKSTPESIYETIKDKPFDAYFVYSENIRDYFSEKGIASLYLPFAVNTEMYRPVEYDSDFDYEVAYVGNDIKGKAQTEKYLLPATKFHFGLYGNWNYYNHRRYLFRKIRKQFWKRDFYDLMILIKSLRWQPGAWLANNKKLSKISQGKIPQNDMIKLLSSSKILINFTLKGAVNFNTLNYRILEILACKGFVITDRVPVVEEELKDCVVFTDGGWDLERKIRYYLKHPQERKAYAQRGYDYVLKHYSADARAKEIFDFVNKLIKGGNFENSFS